MALHDIVTKDSTDRSVTVKIVDSADGTPETGVVFNTAGIDLWYRRELSAKVSITEVTLAALTTAHADGGFITIGDGEYRLDLPDAAFATGAQHVDFGGTVTGMVVIGGRVRLVDFDVEAALATAAALATVDTVVDEILGDTAEILWRSVATAAALATVDTVVDAILVDTGTTIPATIATVDTVVDSILVDTAEIGAAGAGLTALPVSPANVTQWLGTAAATPVVAGVPSVDVIAATMPLTEPTGMFAWSGDLEDALNVLAILLRNELNITSSTISVRNDADNATVFSYAISDDATTFTNAKGA
jgi:hypothetical protein